jgi:hypothetical protein
VSSNAFVLVPYCTPTVFNIFDCWSIRAVVIVSE